MSKITEELTERFSTVYKNLLVSDIKAQILGGELTPLPASDLAYLVSSASRLALSAENDSRRAAERCQLAYDIAVRAPRFANGGSFVVVPLCEAILSRIGNFPARRLLTQSTADIPRAADPFIQLEIAVREEENWSADAPAGITLTDFQIRLLTALREVPTVSVSAPTSAGKSFTLELELLHRFKTSTSYVAVFLVPTRALIRQVSADLANLLRGNGVEAEVLTSVSVPEPEDATRPRRMIFVLTQERFATLLGQAPPDLNIDMLIVDEAQEIGKDRRGMTLERVINMALRRYPTTRLFFSSPLRSNPEFLVSLFSRPATPALPFVEYQRPVSQNIILVKTVKSVPSAAELEMLTEVGTVKLGRIDLPFKFRGRYLTNLAQFFTAEDDVSIIYCNRPSDADKVATELAELFEASEDEELNDFGNFLQQEVHRHYRLGSMVRKGVGFHYANIPQILRSRIEELAKSRKLRFVCCTSTLLQGVNLPARNIFLENPKTGMGSAGKIHPGDFWNLVGRAGRMNQEFSGNVFCIFGKKWDSDPLTDDRMMPIESAFHVALQERTKELGIWATTPPTSAEGSEAWAEQAFANIYADFVATGKRVSDSARDEATKALFAVIDTASEQAFAQRTLPDEIFANNMYVHPRRLEELAALFRGSEDLLSLRPVQPFATGAYENLAAIFFVLEQVFIKSNTQRHRYLAYLGLVWIQGMPIRNLVKARLDYRKIPDDEKAVNEEIRDLFREIEDELRYRYVKYTNIYLQVLAQVLRERNQHAEADKLLPLPLFLEFGASSRVLINLMSLGLSRTSSILLQRTVSLPEGLTVTECRRYLEAINLTRIALPAICKAEVARLRGRAES